MKSAANGIDKAEMGRIYANVIIGKLWYNRIVRNCEQKFYNTKYDKERNKNHENRKGKNA